MIWLMIESSVEGTPMDAATAPAMTMVARASMALRYLVDTRAHTRARMGLAMVKLHPNNRLRNAAKDIPKHIPGKGRGSMTPT